MDSVNLEEPEEVEMLSSRNQDGEHVVDEVVQDTVASLYDVLIDFSV
jgi:hypothetical protein